MSVNSQTARTKSLVATDPVIYNLDMPLAGTEYAQALNTSTKKILVRQRNRVTTKIAFSLGGTNVSWITLEAGAVFFEENLDLSGATIYLQTSEANQVAEILEWT